MPIYMDVHILPGVKARDVAEAHRLDVLLQEEHGCKCMTYWIDEERENVFCLIEAPNKKAVEEMHSRAHGLVPNKIIEVNTNIVESFLGRIYDPTDAETTEDGLKIFKEPSFRVILLTQIKDPALLDHGSGKEKASELLQQYVNVARKNISQYGGREVEQAGSGLIVSFVSAVKALNCALAIQKEMEKDAGILEFRMAIHAGEPVSKKENLFGDTIQLAHHFCSIAKNNQIAISSSVKDLVSKDHYKNQETNIICISPQDETFIELLFNKLAVHWQDPQFSVDDFSKDMAMSQSQLYRKSTELFGLSPNLLLKEYRLEKAKELMKKQQYTISQITFDSGFTSPSYFTKCFKSKYGLLPMEYGRLSANS